MRRAHSGLALLRGLEVFFCVFHRVDALSGLLYHILTIISNRSFSHDDVGSIISSFHSGS